ncbi:septum formation initiator family protein [Arthrobacter sp. B3I4]|uniref:FtsB family cell division protein n=1 Tax=Arthrobacter sp. B3I4 TaxID=3042267 RepID=UPI002789DEB8|nr:septum formation initiator family protein [Arthrobacter sp. B3I4]MDQ0757211.1 cell division protein FtsB [Arthrobacter sp. B3I4]
MATRRPKVPRAAAAAPKPTAAGHGGADGGDVIRADFGGRQEPRPEAGAAGSARSAPAQPSPAQPSRARASAGANAGAGKARSEGGSKTRPGSATERGSDAGNLDPVPAKAFSGRMLALALVMVAITIMLAPSVKIFVEKRAEIAALEADISAKQTKQNDLKRQVSRWQDPNYVKQQARDRINMVMPGETGYWVFGSDLPAGTSGAGAAAGTTSDPADLPWVDSLWESIRRSATD